jgi:selT/selW/selH-like putative selenoprotein
MILIACIVIGQNPFTWFNINTPNIYSWAMENKIYSCMMLFFLVGLVEGQLLSTGAFEILFNDVPVWSKLESGRVPSPQEMFEIVDSHMRLSSSSS